jgi:hypothetical protein
VSADSEGDVRIRTDGQVDELDQKGCEATKKTTKVYTLPNIWRCADKGGNVRASGGQTKVTVTVDHHL